MGKNFPFGQPVVWEPHSQWIADSNLQNFMKVHDIPDYDTLMQRSIEDIEWFWDAVLKHLDIRFYQPYSKIIDIRDGIQFPRWCVDGKLNIIHNCLDKWQNSEHKNRIVLLWEGEDGQTKSLSYEELFTEVNRCANGLREAGLSKGDTVGLFMPMIPELLIAFLAIIKIGGIILPLFSGFGPSAIRTRLKDGDAKMVFTTDLMIRRNKVVRMKRTLDEALKHVPSVRRVVVVRRTAMANLKSSSEIYPSADIKMIKNRDLWWEQLIRSQSNKAETEVTAAEDVLMIIYTSGTTGKPKGAVHTHCGFPIKAAQDMFHSMDLKPDETMYWMSDMGWMMGPWQVFGTLLIGATMVFYDGAPNFPDHERLWSQVEKHRVTHLGITPTLIRTLIPHGTDFARRYDLTGLRMVGSTGSPWDPESWNWLFRNVLQEKKPIFNYSGGTEISGGILCGNFFKPMKPCAFSGPVPGMAADVVDDSGNSVRQTVGELAIRKPWIGMTRGFWQDKERYLNSYWGRLSGIWVHGDYAAIDEDGLWYILGRSDDTIKVAGKRLGPAEVESIINRHPLVAESAAIGVPHPVKGEEVVVFCVLNSGIQPAEELRETLMNEVASELGKPLKPKFLRFVQVLPKTRNAKIMHRIIRSVYLGKETGDLSSLEDPSTLEAIKESV